MKKLLYLKRITYEGLGAEAMGKFLKMFLILEKIAILMPFGSRFARFIVM